MRCFFAILSNLELKFAEAGSSYLCFLQEQTKKSVINGKETLEDDRSKGVPPSMIQEPPERVIIWIEISFNLTNRGLSFKGSRFLRIVLP
jgi:hypothetical protein